MLGGLLLYAKKSAQRISAVLKRCSTRFLVYNIVIYASAAGGELRFHQSWFGAGVLVWKQKNGVKKLPVC
jgi:hypothetical protein